MKKQLGRKTYFKIELARICLYPILLVLIAGVCQWLGLLSPELSGIVWTVILIETVANTIALAIFIVLES
jgi:hypothetical protein